MTKETPNLIEIIKIYNQEEKSWKVESIKPLDVENDKQFREIIESMSEAPKHITYRGKIYFKRDWEDNLSIEKGERRLENQLLGKGPFN